MDAGPVLLPTFDPGQGQRHRPESELHTLRRRQSFNFHIDTLTPPQLDPDIHAAAP